jgi:WD40 repeat protein
VVYSPNGRWVVTACWDSVIRIYDPAKADPIRESKGHAHRLRAIALSHDGRWMASTGLDRTVRLWSLETGTLARQLPKQSSDDWASVAFSPDGSLVAAGTNGLVRIWNSKTGQSHVISTGEGVVRSLAFSPNRALLATASSDALRLWQVDTGQVVYNLVHKIDKDDPGAYKLEFSHDGRLLASANKDESGSIWEVSTGKELKILSMREPGEKEPTLDNNPSSLDSLAFALKYRVVPSLAFSPDDRTLFTAASFAGVITWDVATGDKVNVFRPKTWSGLPEIALSSDGKVLVASNEDGSLNVWPSDIPGEPRVLPSLGDPVHSLMFHPNGCCLITIGEDGSVRGWDASDGREAIRLVPLDNDDWAAVDSEGRFDASSGGMKLLQWVVGLETITLEQLKERYYEPGLLAKAFRFNKESLRDVTLFTDVSLFPEVKVEARPLDSTKLKVEVANRGGGIGRIQVLVNNKELLSDARDPNLDQNAANATVTVDLAGASVKPGEPNEVRVVTWNAEGYLSSRGLSITYSPQGVRDQRPPELYAIVSGITEYSGNIGLHFAAKDARDIARTLEMGGRRLFGNDHVHLTLLTSPALSGEQLATSPDYA